MAVVLYLLAALAAGAGTGKKHHHHHHHKHHHHALAAANATQQQAVKATKDAAVNSTEAEIMSKMKELEKKMDDAEGGASGTKEGRIIVNGPLPTDFAKVFANAVAEATGCDPNVVVVKESHPVAVTSFIQLQQLSKGTAAQSLNTKGDETVEVVFDAPAAVVDEVEKQAADAESKLVNGQLHDYLVADDSSAAAAPAEAPAAAPAHAVDIDTEMPYGELEPFGREDTAQELTDQSVQESDEMVDQLERAEVAEEKRSVFRALTRLRGAAITSYDGIARSQTGNIDEYNHVHKWRQTHPLHHLADEESDVSKWAFPDNAD